MEVTKLVTLYSTGCPRCKMLEKALNDAGIVYNYCTDIDTIAKLGVKFVPVLETKEGLLDYAKALQWIHSGGGTQ